MEAASLAEAPEAPGSAAADAAVPSVAQVDAAAPVPAAAPLATPAATQVPAPSVPVKPATAPRVDRADPVPQAAAVSPSPNQAVPGSQTADAPAPEPRRRAANKLAAEAAALASPAASAAAAQLVRSQAQAQLQAAWAALRQGDAAKAQTLYQQVLAERPDDPDATLGLAVSLHRQRQHEAAWAAYQRSLQIWPDNDTARTGMLAILSDSDPATAESRLQEWVQSRPRDAAAQAALGNLLGRQGRWPEALGPLTLAQSLAPGHAAYAYNLAVALDQARRYEEALRMYRQALQQGASGTSGVPVRAVERRIDELQELWTQ
jgi:tetratricopeptide (TPR) repeat protein